jgi:ABC-type multidrug transport system ATPase subunit/ABC-type multidrug transport system permease subunit
VQNVETPEQSNVHLETENAVEMVVKEHINNNGSSSKSRSRSSSSSSSTSSSSSPSENRSYSSKQNNDETATSTDEDPEEFHRAYIEKLRSDFLANNSENKSLFVSPEEQIELRWENMNYSVKQKEKVKGKKCQRKKTVKKTILNQVSGVAEPGKLVCIIGPSGAGKTTLLNVLAGRVTKKVDGKILVNEKKIHSREFNRMTGFVSQEDVLMGSMTTYEALKFTAQMKLPSTMTSAEKEERVMQLLDNMGLTRVKDNFMGFTGAAARNSGIKRGLSGGERKRASIAIELITYPKLLFLDEPTSGLDSYAAKAVMRSLRNLAFMGHTIVATVHQPSADIFKMFDTLIVMAEGAVVYNGPAWKATSYFSSLGYPCPRFKNPADHFMKVLFVPEKTDLNEKGDEENVKQATLKTATPEQVKTLITSWQENQTKYIPMERETTADTSEESKHKPAKYNINIFKQFGLLFKRSWNNAVREPALTRARAAQSIGIGLIAGLLWLQLSYNQLSIRNRVAALFFIIITGAFGGINGPTYLFPNERGVFVREKKTKTYSTGAYFLGKTFADLPLNIILPFLSVTICYWLVGLNPDPVPWIIVCCVLILMTNVAYSLALLMSCAIPDPSLVVKIQPLILLPFMIFSGFFVNKDSIPVYFIWFEYISFVKYAFRAAFVAVFQNLTFTCDDDEYVYLPDGTQVCPTTTGQQVIDQFALGDSQVWIDCVILIGMIIAYQLAAYIALKFTKR